eukprot:gene23565-9791_t
MLLIPIYLRLPRATLQGINPDKTMCKVRVHPGHACEIPVLDRNG